MDSHSLTVTKTKCVMSTLLYVHSAQHIYMPKPHMLRLPTNYSAQWAIVLKNCSAMRRKDMDLLIRLHQRKGIEMTVWSIIG